MGDYKFKTKPYAHQLECLKLSWNKTDYAYFMEMGTGKSKVAIDNMAALYIRGNITAILIIAPKSVYQNWERLEIPLHLPDYIQKRIVLWKANITKKQKKLLQTLFEDSEKLKICIMNVESFSTSKGYRFAEKFLLSHPSMIILDESTSIKSPTAKRTKNILELREFAKYRRILTGMPVTKWPLDLYTQCYFLDPYLLGFFSFYAFRNRYAVMKEIRMGAKSFKQVVSFQRLTELQDSLQKFSFRKLKSECLDLPDKIYQIRNVQLTNEQQKVYDQMKALTLAVFKNKQVRALDKLSQLLRLHQITCGHFPSQDGEIKPLENNKLAELLSVLEEIQGKVVIFATYRYDIKKIIKTLQETYGSESVEGYYGDTKSEDRQDIIEKFQDSDSKLKYFVANPTTGGLGITLTAAHTVIYYSNNYDLEKRKQSEDRVHRIGQKSKVTYIDIVAEGTIDEKILQTLKKKIQISTLVMGDEIIAWLV